MKPLSTCIATIMLLSLCHFSWAQETSDIDMDEYFSELNLTNDQKTTFDEITAEYYSGLQEVQANETSKVKMYKGYKSHKKTRDSKMKKLLSPDQFDLYTTKQKALEKQAREENK